MFDPAMRLVCRHPASSPGDFALNKRLASDVSFLGFSGQVSLHRELRSEQGVVALNLVATMVICNRDTRGIDHGNVHRKTHQWSDTRTSECGVGGATHLRVLRTSEDYPNAAHTPNLVENTGKGICCGIC